MGSGVRGAILGADDAVSRKMSVAGATINACGVQGVRIVAGDAAHGRQDAVSVYSAPLASGARCFPERPTK